MSDASSPKRKGRPRGSGSFGWRAFFQNTTTPLFVLGKNRRLRFANVAWEKLTGVKLADALGLVCSAHRHSSALAAALAPPPEARAGKPDRARRPAPGSRPGHQWWDITFLPLAGDDGVFGIVGFISVVGEAVPAVARKIPPSVAALRERHAREFSFDWFSGAAPASVRFLGQLRHAAQSPAPVWLVGEPGSGKETAARVLHHNGPWRERAFVGIDCAGLQPYLIESLLFGHGGLLDSPLVGTLYLKHPAAMPRDLQLKLADRFTDPPAGFPRLVSGSSQPAAEELASGKLVSAFHTALAVLELSVPPLRERVADLPRLCAHIVPGVAIEAGVFDVLSAHRWPGNLRELAGVLVEAAADGAIRRDDLPRDLRLRATSDPPPAAPRSLALDPLLEAVERRMIQLALRRTNNHQTEAAELLGIFRARLWRRLEALGLPVPPQPPRPRKSDGTQP